MHETRGMYHYHFELFSSDISCLAHWFVRQMSVLNLKVSFEDVSRGVTQRSPKRILIVLLALRKCVFIIANQASVLQRFDSAIQRLNHYPLDKYYQNLLDYPVYNNDFTKIQLVVHY